MYLSFTVHVIEETSDVSMGVELLTSTRDDWSGSLQGHISWHLTLFYLGKSLHVQLWTLYTTQGECCTKKLICWSAAETINNAEV